MNRRNLSTVSEISSPRPTVVRDAGNDFRLSKQKHSPFGKGAFFLLLCILAAVGVPIATREAMRTIPTMNAPQIPTPHGTSLQSTGQTSLERSSPVTVQLGEQESNVYDHVQVLRTDRLTGEKENSWLGEEWDNSTCIPMHKWQLPMYGPSSCNLMHEMDMTDVTNDILTLINCGGSRCAFQINDSQGIELVIKKPRFSLDTYEQRHYDGAWLDTISMERLSSSPFILDMYGNCGVAQLTELSRGGNLHDLIKIARLHGDQMSPENKLRIGYQVAAAVGDLHSFDGDTPSLAHNDLCCHQFVLIDGVYKLNDFHLASALSTDRQGSACINRPKDLSSYLDKTRAPEELKRNGKIRRDKADVWMMGNILYNLLTKKWLFEGIPTKVAKKALINGELSKIPSEYLDSTNAADQAMIKAIQMAWVYNPDARPTAREIANFLKQHLDHDRAWRVSIPPLPHNHRHTESDFLRNLEM